VLWYISIFVVIGLALVAAVLWRLGHRKPVASSRPIPRHHTNRGTERASYTDHGSRERKERARRRSQSAHDRHKRR